MTHVDRRRGLGASYRRTAAGIGLLALAVGLCGWPVARAAAAGDGDTEDRRYTYSWLFADGAAMRPRGGTTRGPELTLATQPSAAWHRLVEPGLSDFERDRRAILAMAGAYRTTFDFIETIGFTPDYQARPPYQSWATEQVRVITDEPRFISLQHILVMRFVQDDGTVSEPMVTKHWRQDWRYEDGGIHVYAGHGRWAGRVLPAAQRRGTWSQAVFQVDDSPRYQARGRWQHNGNHSTWTSDHTWRPLPRRESSVREDYHVLAGINRVSITPQGWIHEEDNLKMVLDADGQPATGSPYLAREAGLNRYRRIVDYDFSAGDDYWRRTRPFWGEVRAAWRRTFAAHDTFALRPAVDGKPLFLVMFELADEHADPHSFRPAEARQQIEAVLTKFIRPADGDERTR